MNELEAVSEPGPRDDGIVKWLAGGFDSLGGYFLYGVMWFGISVAFVAIVPDLVLPKGFGRDHFGLVLLGAFAVPWIPFVAWVRWRRSAIRRLFRDGVLVSSQITHVTFRTKRGVDGTEVRVAFESGAEKRRSTIHVFGSHTQLAVGESMPLLYEPSCRYVAAFPTQAAPVAATSSRG